MAMGNSDEITREYFDKILIEFRQIDADLPETKVTIFGTEFATPVTTAALSHLNNTCENGMAKMAEGAKLAGALCFSGMGEKEEIEAMCATGAKVIKIVKPHANEEDIFREIREAVVAGAFGVGMDIDHAFNGSGGYDSVFGQKMRPKTLEQLKSYIAATKLPFVIKGVLSVSDAKKAVEAGAAGIVVSHHHGIMNYAVPPLYILPEIVAAVGGKVTIFVDCDIESGMDVFKALALGADAVSVGRAIMGPLKDADADGVKEKLQAMTGELRAVMGRTGFKRIGEMDASVLHFRTF